MHACAIACPNLCASGCVCVPKSLCACARTRECVLVRALEFLRRAIGATRSDSQDAKSASVTARARAAGLPARLSPASQYASRTSAAPAVVSL
eukprot:123376-Pleurochrysis_carterae.AAC.1